MYIQIHACIHKSFSVTVNQLEFLIWRKALPKKIEYVHNIENGNTFIFINVRINNGLSPTPDEKSLRCPRDVSIKDYIIPKILEILRDSGSEDIVKLYKHLLSTEDKFYNVFNKSSSYGNIPSYLSFSCKGCNADEVMNTLKNSEYIRETSPKTEIILSTDTRCDQYNPMKIVENFTPPHGSRYPSSNNNNRNNRNVNNNNSNNNHHGGSRHPSSNNNNSMVLSAQQQQLRHHHQRYSQNNNMPSAQPHGSRHQQQRQQQQPLSLPPRIIYAQPVQQQPAKPPVPTPPNRMSDTSDNQNLRCNFCGRTNFIRGSNLRAHVVNAHFGPTPYACHHCRKKFAKKCELTAHKCRKK